MTEQFYRVCWRTYRYDGTIFLRSEGPEELCYPMALRLLVRFREIDAFYSMHSDYWLEPV